jgi:hypothetical protein
MAALSIMRNKEIPDASSSPPSRCERTDEEMPGVKNATNAVTEIR